MQKAIRRGATLIALPSLAVGLALSVLPRARAENPPAYPSLFRPPVPSVPGTGDRNPIDAFVGEAQLRAGVSGSDRADKTTLIRRLTFDLTGLPPTPEQVLAFESDHRPDAYERLVDRLLASPAFGERQAATWLALVRHADSSGFEEDSKRPNAWRYRDWVVNAFNTDMPFDRFLGYQLAADELAADQPPQLAALGFLRAGPTVGNERNERTRLDELDDIVTTTGSVFLGLTVGCARCHDHKTDPIPTADYYRLLAVFTPAKPVDRSLETLAEQTSRKQAVEAINATQVQLREDQSQASADDAMACSVLAEYQGRIDACEQRKPAVPLALGVVETGGSAPATHVQIRGEPGRQGPEVLPGPPRWVAGEVIDFPEPSRRARSSLRRSALALWMTDRANPLTSRVIVNRLWQGHFGAGLVRTPSDFGGNGDVAALPRLLDWLACELVDRRWSLKAIHRLIVTSETYTQSSRVRDEARRLDPSERLIWRYPLRRLEAEQIRDAVLACSASLNPVMGGPGVFRPIDASLVRTGNLPRWPLNVSDGPDVWRRSIYLFKLRSLPDPFLELFDQSDLLRSCPARTSTTTPTQSLTMMNDPALLQHASRLATRIERECGDDPAASVDRLFLVTTGRLPAAASRSASLALLQQAEVRGGRHEGLTDLALALYNSNAFLTVD